MALTKAQKIQITASLIVGFMSVFAISYLTTSSGSTLKVAENNMFRITIPDGESECSQCLKEFNVTFKGKYINKEIQQQMGINTSTLSSIQILNNASKNLLKVILKDGDGNVLAIPTKLEMLTEFRKMNPESRTYVKSYEWAEFPYHSRDFYMAKDKPAQFRVIANVPEGMLVYGTILFTFENVSLEIDPAWWIGLGSEQQLIVTNITASDIKFSVNQNSLKPYYVVLNKTTCTMGMTNTTDVNLTAYWPFDELSGTLDGKYALDYSGNNNNLFIVDGTDSYGAFDGCAGLSAKYGNSASITGQNKGSATISKSFANLSKGFAIEFWMLPNNQYSSGSLFKMYPSLDLIYTSEFDDVGVIDGRVNNTEERTAEWTHPDTGDWYCTWNHIAWVVNPTTQRNIIYRNGAIAVNASLGNSSPIVEPTTDFNITVNATAVGVPPIVAYDELKIWNKPLTTAEVLASYTSRPNTAGKTLHSAACSYKIEENKSNYMRFGIEQTNQTFEIFPTAIVNDTGNAVLFNVTDASYYSFIPTIEMGEPFRNVTRYSWNLSSTIVGNDTFEINVTGLGNVTRVCQERYCNVRNPSYWSEAIKDYKDPNLLLYISGEYFNGTHYVDLSDNDFHGQAMNMNIGIDNCTGNSSGWTTSGKFGKALQFDGVNDNVDVGGISANYKEVTIEAWVYPHSLSGMMTVATFEGAGFLGLQTDGSNLLLGLRRGASCDYRQEYIVGMVANTWHHVAGTYSNATNGRAIIYHNVNIGYNGSEDGLLCNVQNEGYIGYQNGWGRYWNGTIDEVRIYNRALSAEEINASYNAGMDRLFYSMPYNMSKNLNVSILAVNGTVDIRNRQIINPSQAGPYIAGMAAAMLIYYYLRRRR